MIAVDTSALMAVALGESRAADCMDVLQAQDELVISAGTLTEALIVAAGRGVLQQLTELLQAVQPEVVSVTAASARRAAHVHSLWGKGIHPAGLNYGDCFAYELAKQRGCPLLYIGQDFAATDIPSAL